MKLKKDDFSKSELAKKSKKVRGLIVARVSILATFLIVLFAILAIISYFVYIKPGIIKDNCYKEALEVMGESFEGTAGFNFLVENCLQIKGNK